MDAELDNEADLDLDLDLDASAGLPYGEPVNKVEIIRDRLMALTGQRVRVRANMGRSRVVERDGTLLQTHGSLFVVEVDERRGRKSRQSYQYVDVLTGAVELCDMVTGEPVFEAEKE